MEPSDPRDMDAPDSFPSDEGVFFMELSETKPRPERYFDQRGRNDRRDKSGRTEPRLSKKPQTSAPFLRHKKHDVIFTSLRLMVFKIDPRSATPIAHLLREDLSDADAYQLINNIHESTDEEPTEQSGAYLQDEQSQVESPDFGRLLGAIDDARAAHAVRLRDAKMQDVDVMYSGHEAAIAVFKEDQDMIQKLGGTPYHLWPYDQEKKIIGMSVIAKSGILAAIYPAERLALGGIEITNNTEQAPLESQPKSRLKGGSTVPRGEQNPPEATVDNSGGDGASARKVLISDTVGSIGKKYESVPIPVLKSVKHASRSPSLSLSSLRNFTGSNALLIPGSKLIQIEFDRRQWDVDAMPDTARTSPIYACDRNLDWYAEHVAKAEAAENEFALKVKEREYLTQRDEARWHNRRLRQAQVQAKHDLAHQLQVKHMRKRQKDMDDALDETKQSLAQLRKDGGHVGWPRLIAPTDDAEMESLSKTAGFRSMHQLGREVRARRLPRPKFQPRAPLHKDGIAWTEQAKAITNMERSLADINNMVGNLKVKVKAGSCGREGKEKDDQECPGLSKTYSTTDAERLVSPPTPQGWLDLPLEHPQRAALNG